MRGGQRARSSEFRDQFLHALASLYSRPPSRPSRLSAPQCLTTPCPTPVTPHPRPRLRPLTPRRSGLPFFRPGQPLILSWSHCALARPSSNSVVPHFGPAPPLRLGPSLVRPHWGADHALLWSDPPQLCLWPFDTSYRCPQPPLRPSSDLVPPFILGPAPHQTWPAPPCPNPSPCPDPGPAS